MRHLKTLVIAALTTVFSTVSSAQNVQSAPLTWDGINYEGHPWVENVSAPFKLTKGLHNRHISLWASHGRYYDVKKGGWKWQRPKMFCTTEDLFTQTIVVPYLIPMLENSGACVFTPRERDWQRNEVIVDNDDSHIGVGYIEVNTKEQWQDAGRKGFAQHEGMYIDRENPFAAGTVRLCPTIRKAKKASIVSYQPQIPEAGQYAVYVSYATMENSADDVTYTVWHKGQETHFKVNQKMGGGTWVYLGTFDFDEGCNEFNRVVVSNFSNRKRSVVTTEAVRFGGGMGNIARLPLDGVYLPQDTTATGQQLPPSPRVSGLPRCLEGARYYAQWAGMPYEVYSGREGTDDYADDINSRSFMTNYVGGGSVYMPNQQGLGVPIELSLGVHSDAGYGPCDSIVGTLSICTTDFNDGLLDAGISRQASRNFAQRLLDEIPEDIAKVYGKWNRRELYDRNYSESRVPCVPSAILETMSHQNFNDMRYGHDPNFKFTIARSIYKSILRYVNFMHDKDYVVAPLAPDHFAVSMDDDGEATLTWQAVNDPNEPTAEPAGYVVYTSTGSAGFDNGTYCQNTKMKVKLEPGVLYSFRVAAVNKGGRSFMTEVLSASYTPGAKHTVMIVNAFNRLASPAVKMDDEGWRFDIVSDPGVSYGKTTAWIGKQLDCDPNTAGKEGPGGLGYSDESLMGQFTAGNDFNYVATHARALHSAGLYNIVSCSDEALTSGKAELTHCQMADIIFGLERNDGYSLMKYEVMSAAMRRTLEDFTRRGGSLLVSGSYIASDMAATNRDNDTRAFLNNILKCHLGGTYVSQNDAISGLGTSMQFYHQLNEQHYAATRTDILSPLSPAFATMLYSNGNAACVAYNGNDYRAITMGFPFECIKGEKKQGIVMRALARFLLKN